MLKRVVTINGVLKLDGPMMGLTKTQENSRVIAIYYHPAGNVVETSPAILTRKQVRELMDELELLIHEM